MHARIALSLLLVLALAASPAGAYRILVDLDVDGDPGTIEDLTFDDTAVVKLVLQPDYPGEPVGSVAFGLGGACRECDHVHHYGVRHDLIDGSVQPWIQAAGFDSGWDAATTLGCPGDPGYHLLLWFEPVGGGTIDVEQAFFLAEFTAWIATPPGGGCLQAPATLGTFEGAAPWNLIRLGGPPIPNEPREWGGVKAVYR